MYLTPTRISEIVAGLPKSMERAKLTKILEEVALAINYDAGIQPTPAGTKAMAVLRVANPVQDGETVSIGPFVFEVDTCSIPDIVEGNIRLDLSGNTTAKAQGTLTIANVASAGDTMTIGEKVYTFVPAGTANADGEIDVGADQVTQEAAIKAAINGTDGWNDPHPLVTCSDFAAHIGTITAISGGTQGNLIATTETFAAVGNVFDDVTLGTTTSGVDPIADEFTDALVAAIAENLNIAVGAAKISANEVLIFSDVNEDIEIPLAETLAGLNNEWDSEKTRGGSFFLVPTGMRVVKISRVPTAIEVAIGNLHIPLAFVPSSVFVNVRTATGLSKAWNGATTIVSGDEPYVTLDNSGTVDWAATDIVTVLILD